MRDVPDLLSWRGDRCQAPAGSQAFTVESGSEAGGTDGLLHHGILVGRKRSQLKFSLSGTGRHTRSNGDGAPTCVLTRSFLQQAQEAEGKAAQLYLCCRSLLEMTASPEFSEAAHATLRQSKQIREFLGRYFPNLAGRLHGRSPDGERGAAVPLKAVDLSLGTLSLGSDDHVFASAFDDRRDSYSADGMLPKWVYDSRQKLRDGFFLFLQECLHEDFQERQVALKAREHVFSRLVTPLNGEWLAQLVTDHFVKCLKPPHYFAKLQLLERRLSPGSGSNFLPRPSRVAAFFQHFIQCSDSLSFISSLSAVVPGKIDHLEGEAVLSRRPEAIARALLASPRLLCILDCLNGLVGCEQTSEDILGRARQRRCLVLYAQYRDAAQRGSFGRAICDAFAVAFAGSQAGLAVVRDDPHFLDSDPGFPMHLIFECCFPELCLTLGQPDSAAAGQAASAASTPLPRKVQIQKIEDKGPPWARPRVSPLQRDLRKWFWWQHPHEHELARALVAYPTTDEPGLRSTLQALLTHHPAVTQTAIGLAVEELRSREAPPR